MLNFDVRLGIGKMYEVRWSIIGGSKALEACPSVHCRIVAVRAIGYGKCGFAESQCKLQWMVAAASANLLADMSADQLSQADQGILSRAPRRSTVQMYLLGLAMEWTASMTGRAGQVSGYVTKSRVTGDTPRPRGLGGTQRQIQTTAKAGKTGIYSEGFSMSFLFFVVNSDTPSASPYNRLVTLLFVILYLVIESDHSNTSFSCHCSDH